MALAITGIAACSHSKKTTMAATPAPPPPPPPVASTNAPAKPYNGVYAPGAEELAAVQVKHKEVTMQTLNTGYAIYTGACTNCHKAKNIYRHPTEEWPGILDDMAPKAKITEAQKQAVYMYVLAIKAAAPEGMQPATNNIGTPGK